MRVLVVDDDPFSRTAICAMLESKGVENVRAAEGVSSAIEHFGEFSPNVVVVDLDLGEGPNGVDLVESLRRRDRGIRVVVLSTYESPRLLGVVAGRIPSDVAYVAKAKVTSANVLIAAIEGFEAQVPEAESVAVSHKLSDLNLEILRLVARGLSNAEIATRLVVSERTVEKSIARLIKTLQIPADKTQNQRVMLTQLYFGMAGIVRSSPASR